MPQIPIIMPQLGESIAEATVVNFLVQPGALVEPDQDLLEVETNKATMTVTAPCRGRVEQFLVQLIWPTRSAPRSVTSMPAARMPTVSASIPRISTIPRNPPRTPRLASALPNSAKPSNPPSAAFPFLPMPGAPVTCLRGSKLA
jgi:hypothetical protein